MVRHTSIDVYNRIKNEGLLSKLRFKVYDFLYQNNAMTCRELMDAMIKSKNASPEIMAGGTISSRFSELERLGVICEVRERKCKVTIP